MDSNSRFLENLMGLYVYILYKYLHRLRTLRSAEALINIAATGCAYIYIDTWPKTHST